MDKIIFNDLRREAKDLNLNIDVEADFDTFVQIEQDREPKLAEMGTDPIELWMTITHNREHVKKLLNLDAFAKVHFKKTIQSDNSSINDGCKHPTEDLKDHDGCKHPTEDLKDHDYELYPSSYHLQYMEIAGIAQIPGFDLFDKKSFDDFVVWLYQKTCIGKNLADTKPKAFLNLEKFGLLVHQSSFMDRKLPVE